MATNCHMLMYCHILAKSRGSSRIAEKGVLHGYDFTNPAHVKETRIEPAGTCVVLEKLATLITN